ncbi:LysR family transcriptional regulator [Enterovibrio coralii]|uniref:Transcriptional regulator n=1 Tax=Enterovibrio coralii TaxID=294935 RepID=A0A135IBQ1_9GAMM|nr:LysR family transcriptional regulator [Enterovibrio coralii]KXF82818.1 transcriptional regulator [Enterovibrio coralii]
MNHSIYGNIDDIYLFAQVIQEGSLLAAAKKLSLPVSTMSRRVSALEKRLNIRLLEKQGRELVATENGKQAYELFSSSFEQLETAFETLITARSGVFGNLKVVMPHNFYRGFVGNVLREYLTSYPKVKLDIVLSQEQQPPATDRDLLMTFDLKGLDDLIARPLFHAQHGFFASPDYLRQFGEINIPEDIVNADWIAVDKAWDINLFRDNQLEQTISVRPKLVVNDIAAVMDTVRMGLGVASLPLRHIGEADGLVRVLPEYLRSDRMAYLVYRERKHQPQALSLLIDALINASEQIEAGVLIHKAGDV